ncbi:MAG: hypothetical protein WBC60_13900 [Cognaticolwellia sp.]
MKLLTLLVSFISLFSVKALAHTDHALGEGSFHTLYHIVFWTVFALVIYKGYVFFRNKKSQKN